MSLKTFWSKIGNRLRFSRSNEALYTAMQQSSEPASVAPKEKQYELVIGQGAEPGSEALSRTIRSMDKTQSLEKFQSTFDGLIEQLSNINEHLNYQVIQQKDLMGWVDQVPKLLENFPAFLENQKQLREQFLEQLRATAAGNQRLIDTVEKLPAETAKQTNALTDINRQLTRTSDTDAQMAENFNKFNETLDKLNHNTDNQTDSIMQMSKTFSASDRYLKFIISRQNKRFMWLFIIAVSVCVLIIFALVGSIIYLRFPYSP